MENETTTSFALCLRGMSDNYHITSENIHKTICGPLKPDIFMSTYEHNNIQGVIDVYKPLMYCCDTNQNGPWYMVATHSINCLLMVKEALAIGKHYDYVIITRFDAHFEYDFVQLFQEKGLDPEKFSVLCETEKTGYVDDMLWIVPISMIDALISSLYQIRNDHIWTHSVNIYMNERLGPETTRTLFDGQFYLRDHRPFIKLARELVTTT